MSTPRVTRFVYIVENPHMHIQMTRLYEAANTLKGLTTQAEIARELNMSSQTVNNWEARGISQRGLIAAQAVIGCSATWLDTGEGPMVVAPTSPTPIPVDARQVVPLDEESPLLYKIPKVTLKLQAGVTGFQPEPDRRDGGTMGLAKRIVDRRGYDPAHLIAIEVKGESMEPTLYEGDTVIINLADKALMDNAIYAVNYEGEAIVKRLSRDMGQWWLSSDNPDQRKYYRRACRGNECLVIGRIVWREGERF
jgi:phage repressor protein C with HTH and peptisase S24 domain